MSKAEATRQGAAPLSGTAYDWKGALRALGGEQLPPKLREAVAALAVQGRRLHLSVKAYEAMVARMMGDAAESDLPLGACRSWPEWAERAAARDAYLAAKREAREQARAWAESLEADPDPEASASYPGGREGLVDETGRSFALAVASELEEQFPGPCSSIRACLAGPEYAACSFDAARLLVLRWLPEHAVRELPGGLYTALRGAAA